MCLWCIHPLSVPCCELQLLCTDLFRVFPSSPAAAGRSVSVCGAECAQSAGGTESSGGGNGPVAPRWVVSLSEGQSQEQREEGRPGTRL